MSDLVDINKDFRERSDETFERKVVSDILTFHGLAAYKVELIAANRQETGQRALTLRQFHIRFPGFPAYLFSKVITNLRNDHTVAALLQNFANSRIYTQYCTIREDQLPADVSAKAFGLVIKWPYLQKPAVLHNLGASTERGSMFVCRAKKETLILEPLPSFLRGLGWDPSQDE